jgi:DNA-binding NarL/FixJ family response regulator
MRIVIADDELLLREGLERLLTEAGHQVVGKVGTGDELLRKVRLTSPDVAIVDIRMPPTHTDEGIAAAQQIRSSYPETSVLVLSHYLDARYAMRLMQQHPGGVGYLLKERVSDLALLTDALARLHEGESVIDPTIVSRLVHRPHQTTELDELTEREREVLSLIAEGRSNKGICERLYLSPKTVEAHVKHVLQKLGIEESPDDHRRVLAVLAYLRASASGAPINGEGRSPAEDSAG